MQERAWQPPRAERWAVSRVAGERWPCRPQEEGLDVWSGDRPLLPAPAPPMPPSWTRPYPCPSPAPLN